jgi:hypothetical protein
MRSAVNLGYPKQPMQHRNTAYARVRFVADLVLGSERENSRFRTSYPLSKFRSEIRDSVKIYKKCSADKEAKQHRALTTVPTIMRLSILALFIALPAEASPRQPSTDSEQCVAPGGPCVNLPFISPSNCCEGKTRDWFIGVCLIAQLL